MKTLNSIAIVAACAVVVFVAISNAVPFFAGLAFLIFGIGAILVVLGVIPPIDGAARELRFIGLAMMVASLLMVGAILFARLFA